VYFLDSKRTRCLCSRSVSVSALRCARFLFSGGARRLGGGSLKTLFETFGFLVPVMAGARSAMLS